jgi:hypothetical protein
MGINPIAAEAKQATEALTGAKTMGLTIIVKAIGGCNQRSTKVLTESTDRQRHGLTRHISLYLSMLQPGRKSCKGLQARSTATGFDIVA